MILVLCATNRPGANTRIVAKRAFNLLADATKGDPELQPKFLDLADLRHEIFSTDSYGTKPEWFQNEFQTPILEAKGMILVTPEYNGSFPGVLKYFIDMLKFPESLVGLPVAFIGLAAGQFGALRSVEQMELIFSYRSAHIFGERLFIPAINSVLTPSGEVGPHEERLKNLVRNFARFVTSYQEGRLQ